MLIKTVGKILFKILNDNAQIFSNYKKQLKSYTSTNSLCNMSVESSTELPLVILIQHFPYIIDYKTNY